MQGKGDPGRNTVARDEVVEETTQDSREMSRVSVPKAGALYSSETTVTRAPEGMTTKPEVISPGHNEYKISQEPVS